MHGTIKAAEGKQIPERTFGEITVMPGVRGHNLTCKSSHGWGKAYKMIANKTVAHTTHKN